ncbi:alanyl-tRNA editing protein [Halobacillus locisalis]|uniref:alanyl-tRNA editing protein n=1 Tax=Halobacillus locisalis TaxID=220753 RepID=UPI0031B6332A
MTRKLFYEDPYINEFETSMVTQGQDDRGRHYVVLEETAFYPTGGGQPHDTGRLNGSEVTDVEEVNGELRHYVTSPLVASEVHGSIDWGVRFDHMQQHSAQHMISAIFHDTYGIPTTSFHLGNETSTIDLDTTELSGELLKEVEKRVNEEIRLNHPIETKWMSVSEANHYPLRKPLSVEGDVRLVIIPDIDYNGCGGTHPRTTGEVVAVKFLGWTKSKKQVRLEFLAGDRVLSRFDRSHRVLTGLKQLVSRPEEELVEEVNQLIRASKEKDKKMAELKEQLLQYEARELVEQSKAEKMIQRVFKGRSIKALQSLGKAVVEEAPHASVVLISEQEDQLQFVLARGKKLDLNMNAIAKSVMPLIEGKGGGKPDFVQGGGKNLIDGEAFSMRVKEAIQDQSLTK